MIRLLLREFRRVACRVGLRFGFHTQLAAKGIQGSVGDKCCLPFRYTMCGAVFIASCAHLYTQMIEELVATLHETSLAPMGTLSFGGGAYHGVPVPHSSRRGAI